MFKWIFAGCAYLVAVVLVSVHLLPIRQGDSAGNVASTGVLTARSVNSWRPDRTPPSNLKTGQQSFGTASETRRTRSVAVPVDTATVRVASEPAQQRWTFRIVDADPAIAPLRRAGDDSYSVARSIQREINRVGCANLTITGAWDRRTRAAMASFAANRNATLPTNKPDVILLSLLRTYQGKDCGRTDRSQIARHTERPNLRTTPQLVRRYQRPTVISGWTTQTTSAVRLGSARSVAAGAQQPTSYATVAPSYYRPAPSARLNENRMSLGVRPNYRAPYSAPPVTVQPPGDSYTNELPYDEARRLDAERAAALERAQAEKQRKRRARRRAYRRGASWKTRAFAPMN